ncbi:MAG: ribonuclease E/G [Lachnospiraceae bacterium]
MFSLVITVYNDKILSSVYEDGKMVEVSLENEKSSSYVGNIYVGRVENVVKNINAAFVEFSRGVKGYYSLEDNKNHIFLNKKNNDKVCQGDLMLVQVVRDAVKTKPPTLSCNIEFTGKYIALKKNGTGISISSKITGVKLKKAIKKSLSSFASEEYGIIARTNCESLYDDDIFSDEELLNETRNIIEEYNRILQIAPTRTAFSLLNERQPDFISTVLNARVDELSEIVTDNIDVYNSIKALGDESIDEKIKLYDDKLLPLNKLYSIDTQISDALKERIWLKSGAYLVLQPTEALTVIDVNTGKCVQSKNNREEIFFKVNQEAAIEIAKQLRLRNYSGIILIDFIDMKEPSHNTELLELLSGLVLKDPVKTTVVDITRLGLVELTRKKIKKPLFEQLQ